MLKALIYPLRYQKAVKNPRETTDKLYYKIFRTHINYENPISLNEKIHRLKFYSDTSKWPMLADKYRVREYVTNKGFGSLLNELYAVYDSADAIDISNLPDSFVMKMNNGSGDILIVRDKTKFTNKRIRNYFRNKFKSEYGILLGEYHYRSINPCVIVEKLLVEENSSLFLTDYKFFCFSGRVEFVLVCSERNKKEFTVDTYDVQWRHYDVHVPSEHRKIGNGTVRKPVSFDRMVEMCKKLSEEIPFVRIDLYETDGNPIFGEMTLTPAGGFIRHYSQDFLNRLGGYIELPEKIINDSNRASCIL